MTYYIGAFESGLANFSQITQYTRNMREVNIFAGKVKYNTTTGLNTFSVLKPFQFKDGYGHFISPESPVVFPAPWPWIPVEGEVPTVGMFSFYIYILFYIIIYIYL